MLDHLISGAFTYVLIGSFIAMLSDPGIYIAFALSHYTQRNGRLPPPAWEVIAIGSLIVMWPRVLVSMIRARR